GECSGTPTEPHHTPSPKAQQTSPTTHSSPTLPPVTMAPIPTVTPSDTPHLRQYTRRARIDQSLALPPIADEPTSPLRDVSQGKACPTVSSLDTEQDKANIAKTSTLPHESTSRVPSFAADEGTQELKINRLKARVKLLEDREGGVAERSGDDAPIKGRNLDEGEEAAERVSDDTEEMATILTSIDAASILTSGGIARQLEEEMETDAQRMKEQIARDVEVAKIHAEEELKPWSKKKKRDYYMAVIKSNLSWKVKDFRGMTFEEIEAKFTTVWKQIKKFIPMGSKEEAERFKRKGIRFEQESMKKLKTSKEVKASEEVPKEKVKEMMQLVSIEEHLDRKDLNQLWALVKESLNIKPASSDKEMELWVELKRLCMTRVVTSKDNEIFMMIEKDYPLRKGLAIMMICYKLQVENYSQMASDLILKIHKIANHPRQEDD
nr:hypothetical protein [Tanacetum cinerariifolium]